MPRAGALEDAPDAGPRRVPRIAQRIACFRRLSLLQPARSRAADVARRAVIQEYYLEMAPCRHYVFRQVCGPEDGWADGGESAGKDGVGEKRASAGRDDRSSFARAFTRSRPEVRDQPEGGRPGSAVPRVRSLAGLALRLLSWPIPSSRPDPTCRRTGRTVITPNDLFVAHARHVMRKALSRAGFSSMARSADAALPEAPRKQDLTRLPLFVGGFGKIADFERHGMTDFCGFRWRIGAKWPCGADPPG